MEKWMNKKPEDDEKKVSLDNFIPPSKETNKNNDEATIFMKERQKKHQKYLKTALNTQKKIGTISQTEALIESVRNNIVNKLK
jgi:hypothetical protein